jgi:hypothetical protein
LSCQTLAAQSRGVVLCVIMFPCHTQLNSVTARLRRPIDRIIIKHTMYFYIIDASVPIAPG